MLEVKNLHKRYGNHQVLKGINLTVKKGSVFGFLGPNGAGKSTTMNIMTGLIDFQKGQILLNGQDLRKNKKALRERIGYLPENPVFYPYMNGYEYLKFIGDISNYPPNRLKKRIEALLEQVQLQKAAQRRIGGYSRGMKQRLGLAVALFNQPEYLFLDEPTSALDPEGRLDILNLIDDLQESEITVFLSTHILADVERVCDHVSILYEGEIKMTEEMSSLRQRFIQPIFDLDLEGKTEGVRERLIREDWVKEVRIEEEKVSVSVKDLSTAKIQLPRLISELKVPLVSYQIRKTTLEDLFVRMVNHAHENI